MCCGEQYSINWSTALTPDSSMLPDLDVFTTDEQCSLTATRQNIPGLLRTTFEEFADLLDRVEQQKVVCTHEKKKVREIVYNYR